MENYYDIEEPKKGFTVGKLFKWIAITVIILIYAILIVRCTIFKDDVKITSKVLVNENTVSAYNNNPDEFAVAQYGMNSPWVAVAEGRLIQFDNLYYIDASKQLQFTVKYNKDIAPDLNADGIPFRFRLVDNYDNTNEDYFFEQDDKFIYNYIRICFDNVELIDYLQEPDENGKPKRLKYVLYIDKLMPDGSYFEYCRYMIYDGSSISAPVDFDITF